MSIRSSNPAVSKASGLRPSQGFQKEVVPLLEAMQLPVPTTSLLKNNAQSLLESQLFYAWKRPSHFRSQWLVLSAGRPTLCLDPRDLQRTFSCRLAMKKAALEKQGTIVCEAYQDASDKRLTLVDVLWWNQQLIQNTAHYSQRWKIVNQILTEVLTENHPMNDVALDLPIWSGLQAVATDGSLDKETTLELQPEKCGRRRFVWRTGGGGGGARVQGRPQQQASPRPPAPPKQQQAFVEEDSEVAVPAVPAVAAVVPAVAAEPSRPATPPPQQSAEGASDSKTLTLGILKKDPRMKLPDTYRLWDTKGVDLGYAAIRSIDLSKLLREAFRSTEEIPVNIQWVESFQKYEVKRMLA